MIEIITFILIALFLIYLGAQIGVELRDRKEKKIYRLEKEHKERNERETERIIAIHQAKTAHDFLQKVFPGQYGYNGPQISIENQIRLEIAESSERIMQVEINKLSDFIQKNRGKK